MPIQATFTADFTKWDAALKNATTNLKSFEVATKNVGQQLQRAFATFSGEKVIREANLAAAAVEKLGGVSKLTASEQARLNATVTEALAKYKALGQTAPAELKKLQKETAGVNTAMSGIGSTLLKIGGLFAATFTVGALTRAAKAAIELGGELTDLSSRTGISTQALQEFRFAGGQVGVSMESITSAVGQMQKRLAGGDQSAVAALTHLGLSLKELRSLRPEDQFAALAAKIRDIEDPAARAKLAMDVMGRGALEVMPLLVSNFEQLRQKANDLGVVLDDQTIAALDQMGDTMDALSLVGQAVLANVLVPMAPHLKTLGDFALSAAGGVKLLSEALTFAQNTFSAVLMIAYKTAAAFTEIEVAALRFNRATNPLAAAFGFLDKQIASATQRAEYYRTTANLLTQDIDAQIQNGLKPQAKAVKDSAAAFVPLDVNTKKVNKSAEEAAKIYKSWAASVTGLDKAMKAAALEKNLARLTAEGKLNATATQAIIKEYNELRPSLDRLSAPLEELRTNYQDVLESTRAYGAAQAMVNSRTLPDAARMFEVGQTAVEQYGVRLKYLESTSIDLVVAMNAIPGAVKSTAVAAEAASRTLAQRIGQRLGSSLTANLEDALGTIPQIITDALTHGASFEQTAAAIGTQIGAAIGGALGSALTGGSKLGGQVGAAIGALLGPLLDKIIVTRAEKTQERIREEYGVAISEGLAQAIEDAADRFGGDRQAAKLFNLDRIIEEGGGLSSANIDVMLARLRDVFSAIETGAFTTEEAMDVIDKNFGEFAAFVTRDGALASAALLEIIELNERFGTSSKAVAEFVTAQLTGAIGGLTQFLENAEVTSQAAAQGIAASVFGIFEELTKQGATPLEAIKQLTPVLEKLDAQLKAAGFSGGAAFDQIRAMAALANDAVKGPMIEAITGLGVALEGLHNSGVLTQEMFAGLSTQITDTYSKLIAQGTDGAQALALVGPSLQTLWELQQDFGYAVDAATQSLLDQAEAAGVVGDEHRSAQEQMAIAMDRTADAVEYLAEQFGYVAEEAKKSAEAINKIPEKVNIRVNYDVERLPNPDYGTPGGGERPEAYSGYNERYARGYAKGGVVYAQDGMWAPRGTDTVPAMLTPGEVVLPREVVAALRSSSGGGVTVNLSISAIDGADVTRVVQSPEFRQALTSAVKGNLGGYRTDLRTAIGVR